MIFMPETPIWLVAHNRDEEARRSLQRLRGKYDFVGRHIVVNVRLIPLQHHHL